MPTTSTAARTRDTSSSVPLPASNAARVAAETVGTEPPRWTNQPNPEITVLGPPIPMPS